MCSLTEKYGRNSFDRFGDDLCEEILGYLPLSDCFRLQCVCKQFKRKIFNKQTRLTLSNVKRYIWQVIDNYENSIITELITINEALEEPNSAINNDILKYVMKKCANIDNIIIDGQYVICDETINIITRACKRIKYLSIYASQRPSQISLKCWQQFSEQSLQNLESLTLKNAVIIDIIVTFMQLCPKLKKIHSNFDIEFCFDRCFKENTVFGANIESVHQFLIDDKQLIESFKVFANHFCDQLKSLSIWLNFNDANTDIELMRCLSKFSNLEYLYCGFSYVFHNFVELLKLIGLKLLKVLKIENFDSPLSDVFIKNRFQSLEKLIIESCYDYENLEFLKNCVHLTHLKLPDNGSDASEFKHIHLFVPQLKSIDICIDYYAGKHVLVNILRHLEKLPELCELKIGCTDVINEDDDYCGITTDDVISFIANCSTVRLITIYPKHAKINLNLIREYIESNNRKIQIKTAHSESI